MYHNKMRKAIAMLELIFAMVIMGIVLMSAPSLMMQARDSGIVVAQQEAITAGAAEIDMILSKHWDEEDTNESLHGPILVVDNGDSQLNEDTDDNGNPTGRRVGTPKSSNRSFVTEIGRLNASTIGSDSGENDASAYDDIDDYDGYEDTLTNASTDVQSTEDGNYIDTSIVLNATVSYLQDSADYDSAGITLNPLGAAGTPTTNIKGVSVTVTSGEHDEDLHTNIKFQAFSCNIGTYELKERTF